MKEVSEELIRKLKDILRVSPNLETFKLHHEPIDDSEKMKKIFKKVFDEKYPDPFYQDRWYSRIPGNEEEVLSIRADYLSWIVFSRVELSEIQRMSEEFERF